MHEMNFQPSKCENLRVSRKRISPVHSYSFDGTSRASRFICKNHKLSYKDRLTSHNLLPVNYWLEYLDILFFFKCKLGYINICIDNYVSFYTGSSRRGASRIFLSNVYAKTTIFRDSFFVRILNLWNVLHSDLKSESNVNVF